MAQKLTKAPLFIIVVLACAGWSAVNESGLMLGQPPYPEGYTKPIRKPSESVQISDYPDSPQAFCSYLDVERSGAVSNVHVVLSTGSQAHDDAIVRWLTGQQYVPATLNGKTIEVRIMFGYSLGQMPPEKANYCRWDMYHPEG